MSVNLNPNSGLSPPPPSRHRASSTNLRDPLSLSSLGRRRSSSCLNDHPLSPPPLQHLQQPLSPSIPPPHQQLQSPSMIVLVVSRLLHWLHVSSFHPTEWSSTPSSPRSSTDEFVLPLATPQIHNTITLTVPEKHQYTARSLPHWQLTFPSIHGSIALVILMFPITTAIVLFCLSTLPVSLSWPRTLSDVTQLGRELHGYSQSGPGPLAHVMGVMAISAVWKHAWSIPGSVLWNVLAGALFSPLFATIFLTSLTTIGSACATLLSTPLAPFLSSILPRALDMTRSALGGDDLTSQDPSKPKSSAWVRLSVLRLVGVVPWSGINIACGVCGVALSDCLLGTFIGCLPWTAVTCQIGDIMQAVASSPTPTQETISSLLTSPALITKLVLLSFLSLAPILARNRLRRLISPTIIQHQSTLVQNERQPRFAWVQEWRTKIRLASQSRSRSLDDREELNTLVGEKRAMEELPS